MCRCFLKKTPVYLKKCVICAICVKIATSTMEVEIMFNSIETLKASKKPCQLTWVRII